MTIEDTGTAPVDSGATDDLRLDSPAPVEAEAPAAEVSTENPEAAIDADMQAIWDKRNPPRAEDGKFASKTPSEPVMDEVPESTEGQPPEPEVEQAKPAIDAPISWPKEMKDKWSSLAPDTQEYIARRESEAQSKISQMGQETAAYRPLANVVEQHKDLFAKYQVPPDRGISLLLEAQRKLDANPVAAIAELARNYGVDLGVFGNGQEGQQQPQVAMLQHEIANLKQQLNETAGQVRSRIEAEQKAIETQNLSTIDSFLAGKELAESDYDSFAILIEAERRLKPGATPEKLLEGAYRKFQADNPEKFEALVAQRAAQEEAKRKAEADKKSAEAKKLGSLNVKSSPGASPSSRSMDDTLMEIARKYYR